MKALKLTFLLFVWITLAGVASAQEVKWGPLLKEKAKVTVIDVVGHRPGNTLVLKAKSRYGFTQYAKNFQLQLFDGGFNSTKIVPLNPEFEGNSLAVEFCFESNGQIYLFCSFTNHKLDRKFLFMQKVDSKTLAPVGTFKKMSEVTFEKRYSTGSFSYDFSRDSSKIMLYANTELRKNEPDKYALHVLDQDMNEIWQKTVTLPYSESKFSVEDFAVDNDGNVFMLGVKYQEKGETKRRGTPNYEYKILGYRQDGDEVNEYSVSLGDMFLTDMRIDVSPKKDIVCAGFYSEKGTFSIKGSFYVRIDRKTKEIEKMSSKEFDIDFITMNFTAAQERKAKKREAKGKNVELYEYDLHEIVPRADGGAVLVAEQFYITVVCTYDPKTGARTCTYYYHYNDIIVVSVNPSGDIEWATKIPKRQVSANDGGYWSSYAMMITKDRLHFIFNDTKKNLDIKRQGKYYNFDLRDKNGVVMIASLDAEGNIDRRPLISNQEITAITRPKLCRQVSPTQLMLYAKYLKGFGRGSQFGMVTF